MIRFERSRTFCVLLLALTVAGAGLTGCSGDPEECSRDDLGALPLTVNPPLEGDDETLRRTVVGELESVDFLNFTPPIVRYSLRNQGGGVTTIDTPDLGYALPLTEGSTYTVHVERGTVIAKFLFSWGVVFEDEVGLAGLIVTDWEPGFSVFTEGFGSSDLTATIVDPGCPPRIENTLQFRDVTNRRIEFGLDGATVQLYHRESGSLAGFDIRVFRAERAVHKDTLLNAINQYSFALSRRPPLPE